MIMASWPIVPLVSWDIMSGRHLEGGERALGEKVVRAPRRGPYLETVRSRP